MDLLITLTYIGMIVLGFSMVTVAVTKHVMDGSHRDDEGLHQ